MADQPTTYDANIDRILADGQQGRGVLADHFANANAQIRTLIVNRYGLQKQQNPGLPDLTKEAVDAQVNAELGKIAEGLKDPLRKAARGDTGEMEKMDINKMSGFASSISSTASAVSSGNMFGLLGALPGLLSFPAIGDFLSAGFRYFFDNKDKKNFGQIREEIALERGMEAVGKRLNIDAAKLKTELMADPSQFKAEPPKSIPQVIAVTPVSPPIVVEGTGASRATPQDHEKPPPVSTQTRGAVPATQPAGPSPE